MKIHETYRYTRERVMSQFEEFILPLRAQNIEIHGLNRALPLISDEVIIVAIGGDKVLAFNERDFTLRWEIDLAGQDQLGITPIECLLIGNRLCFSIDKTVFVADKMTGRILEQLELGQVGDGAFVNCAEHERILSLVVGDFPDMSFKWIDSQTFEILKTDNRRFRSLAGTAHFVLAVTGNGKRIVCMNAETMEDAWSLNIQDLPRDPDSVVQPDFQYEVDGGILINGDLVIFGVEGYYVYAVNIVTGKIEWIARTQVRFCGTIGLGPDGYLHLIDSTNYAMINALNGEIEIDLNLGERLKSYGVYYGISKLSFSTTHIFFSDTEGAQLLAFNLSTHQIDWRYSCEMGIPMSCSPILVNGRLYTVDLNGKLYVFESGVG